MTQIRLLREVVMIRSVPQNRLRHLRKEYGLSVEQVSEATGLSYSTLYAIETTEREVTLSTAFKLARFYGLPLENIWQPLYEQLCQEVTSRSIPSG
jgi:putative transcriptional regulator